MNILDTCIIYCLTHEVVLIHQIKLDLSINFFAGVYYLCVFNWNKIQNSSSFKSNENIHKREDGSYYVVSANKASSVTL